MAGAAPLDPIYFTIGDDEFRHGTLNARDEFHCARRVAPLVKSTAILASAAASHVEGEGADWLAGLIEGAAPLLKAFSALSDADADFVIGKCMAVTEIREGENWVPTWNSATQATTVSRLGSNHILRIVYQVMREALTVFFSQAQSSLKELGMLQPSTIQ